jgi:hypothetical protein
MNMKQAVLAIDADQLDTTTPPATPRSALRGMRIFAQCVAVALLVGAAGACSTTDPAEPFVGRWAYAAGSTFTVTCGTNVMSLPADTIVETFVTGSLTDLVKNDSQGCMGQAFNVSNSVASLANSGHSCDIPGGVYTANTATFALSADTTTMTAALTGTYAPTQSPGVVCTTSANSTLHKQ